MRISDWCSDVCSSDLAPEASPGPNYPHVVLGWSGVAASHPHDLEAVGGAVAAVVASDPEVSLKIVGDASWAGSVFEVPEERLIDGGKHPLKIGRAHV